MEVNDFNDEECSRYNSSLILLYMYMLHCQLLSYKGMGPIITCINTCTFVLYNLQEHLI